MYIMRKAAYIVAALLFFLSGIVPVNAQEIPDIPHAFYGSVTINGNPAPDGTKISARVSKGDIIQTQNPVTTINGEYGTGNSPYLLVQGYGIRGATITFYVNNEVAEGTATFSSGAISRMNLSITLRYTLTVTASAGGTASPSGTNTYDAGEVVDITATPASGYRFASWTGGPVANANSASTTITMNDDYTIRANFAAIETTTPPPPPPPPPTTVAPQGLTPSVPLRVDEQGIVQESTQLTSPDDEVTLDIPVGTQMLDANGSPLETITLEELVTPPAPPPAGAIVLAYDFGPDGATFEPAIELKLTYNPADLPEGVNEADLRIAWWDGTEWVMLDSTVNTTTHTISAFVSHFTSFALLGTVAAPPTPAAFTVSNLTVEPASITPGGTVTITVTVTNSGETRGTHTVVLNINGAKEAEKSITLNGGASGNVSFTASRSAAGTYTVTIGALSKTFIIRDVPFEPKPAEFVLSALSVQPAEVAPGETVIISVTVTNSGEVEGTYTVILDINGAKEAEKSITLAGGKSGQVNFDTSRSTAGTYTVTIGALSGSFVIKEGAPEPATFTFSNLAVHPAEVTPGEDVNVTVTVTNSCEAGGTCAVILNINGAKEAEKSIALDGGKSGNVSFTVSRSTTGTYTVAVGDLSTTFTVSEAVVPPPPKAVNWPLIAGIIGAVLLAIVAIFLFIRARNV
jgi:hypothetical protein